MPWPLIAAAAGGALLMGASAYQANRTGSAMSAYNAQLNEMQGQAAEDAARVEESRQRRQTERFFGAMNVARAKSGVAAEGSYLWAMGDSAEEAELDALLIRYGGQLKKLGFEQQASMNRMQQRGYDSSMLLSVFGGGLQGAAGGASLYTAFSK